MNARDSHLQKKVKKQLDERGENWWRTTLSAFKKFYVSFQFGRIDVFESRPLFSALQACLFTYKDLYVSLVVNSEVRRSC